MAEVLSQFTYFIYVSPPAGATYLINWVTATWSISLSFILYFTSSSSITPILHTQHLYALHIVELYPSGHNAINIHLRPLGE